MGLLIAFIHFNFYSSFGDSSTTTTTTNTNVTSSNIVDSKRRQVSPPIKTNLPFTNSIGTTTPSPGTTSKPPIFPISSPPVKNPNEDLPPFMREFVQRRQQNNSSSSNNINNNR